MKAVDSVSDETTNFILNTIEPTVESCSRFNGCYYCDRCQLTEEQLMEGDMNDMDKDMESKLKSMGLDQFIKPENKPVQEVKAEVATQQVKKEMDDVKAEMRGEKKQLDINDFLKQPTVHKSEDKKEEPKVQLNAPENYVDDTKTMDVAQLQKELDKEAEKKQPLVVDTSCCSKFSLTNEEKKVLKALIDRL